MKKINIKIQQEKPTSSFDLSQISMFLENMGIMREKIYNNLSNPYSFLSEMRIRRERMNTILQKKKKRSKERAKKIGLISAASIKVAIEKIENMGEKNIVSHNAQPHLCGSVERIVIDRLKLGNVLIFENKGVRYLVSFNGTPENQLNPIVINLSTREMFYHDMKDFKEGIVHMTCGTTNREYETGRLSKEEEIEFLKIFISE